MPAPVPTTTPGGPPQQFGGGLPPPPPPAAGPYPGAPVYGQAPAGPSANGLAIASMVLGIVWVFGIGSILAVIFGFIGRKQIRESGGRQNGGGMAIAGIVLGFIGVAGLILWIVLIATFTATIDNCLNQAQSNPNATCGVSNTGTTGSGNTGNPFGNSGNTGTIFAPGTTGNSAAPARGSGGFRAGTVTSSATSTGFNLALRG